MYVGRHASLFSTFPTKRAEQKLSESIQKNVRFFPRLNFEYPSLCQIVWSPVSMICSSCKLHWHQAGCPIFPSKLLSVQNCLGVDGRVWSWSSWSLWISWSSWSSWYSWTSWSSKWPWPSWMGCYTCPSILLSILNCLGIGGKVLGHSNSVFQHFQKIWHSNLRWVISQNIQTPLMSTFLISYHLDDMVCVW